MKTIVEREEKRKLGETVTEAMPSSKLQALLDEIRAIRVQKGSGSKIVVFSQWTSFLDIIGEKLKEEQSVYTRLDGSLSNSQRQLALQRFQVDPAVTVMLISLKAGGVHIPNGCEHVHLHGPVPNLTGSFEIVRYVYGLM